MNSLQDNYYRNREKIINLLIEGVVYQCKYNKRNLLKWNVTLVINNLKLEFYSFRIEEIAIRVSFKVFL